MYHIGYGNPSLYLPVQLIFTKTTTRYYLAFWTDTRSPIQVESLACTRYRTNPLLRHLEKKHLAGRTLNKISSRFYIVELLLESKYGD